MKIFTQVQWRHLFVIVLLISMALAPYLVFAQDSGPTRVDPDFNLQRQYADDVDTKDLFTILGESSGFLEQGESRPRTVGEVVAAVINGVLALIGMIFLIEMFYAGYLWMMAQGNDDQVTKAKALIRQAIIGVIIIIAAYAIVYFVLAAVLDVRGGGGGTTAK